MVRLEITPASAQVFVDGFFGGTVEDSTGLTLAAGWHRLEFRAAGYETLAANVTVVSNGTVKFRGSLVALRP